MSQTIKVIIIIIKRISQTIPLIKIKMIVSTKAEENKHTGDRFYTSVSLSLSVEYFESHGIFVVSLVLILSKKHNNSASIRV